MPDKKLARLSMVSLALDFFSQDKHMVLRIDGISPRVVFVH